MIVEVIIYRGLPGSGKSTLVKQFCEALYENDPDASVAIFSADAFWIDPETGEYKFDKMRRDEAHAWCFRQFLAQCEFCGYDLDDKNEDHRYIIVDNTNTRAYEIAPYVMAANAYGFKHRIVTVSCNPAVAAHRNVHAVPFNTIWEMHRALMTETLPAFWNHEIVFFAKE